MVKDHPSVIRYSRQFSNAGLEPEDALQEARLGYVIAERARDASKYDPKKASWNTFATRCVHNYMVDVVGASHRRNGPPTTDLADDMSEVPDESAPAPERGLLLKELIRELPDDARTLVGLALGEMGTGQSLSPYGVAEHLRRTASMPRRGRRIKAAMAAVSRMLREMEDV